MEQRYHATRTALCCHCILRNWNNCQGEALADDAPILLDWLKAADANTTFNLIESWGAFYWFTMTWRSTSNGMP